MKHAKFLTISLLSLIISLNSSHLKAMEEDESPDKSQTLRTHPNLKRIKKLRKLLDSTGLDGIIVPHNDEYQNEELPESSKRLEWLTGFTGSAGTAVITKELSIIFVDGRYTNQAKLQVPDDFEVNGGQSWLPWLKENMRGKVVGYDPSLLLSKDYDSEGLMGILTLKATNENLIDKIWGTKKPSPSGNPITVYDLNFSGEDANKKIAKVSQQLKDQNIDAAFILDLDSIAWLLNIRGTDLPYTPVVLSSLLLKKDGTSHLFTIPRKHSSETTQHLKSLNVTLSEPNQLSKILQTLNGQRVIVDKNKASVKLVTLLNENNAKVLQQEDPSWLFRAKKNPVELENMEIAHVCDGIALCEFLAWFDRNANNKDNPLTERSASEKLHEFRQKVTYKGKKFFGSESFPTISAFGSNAAITP